MKTNQIKIGKVFVMAFCVTCAFMLQAADYFVATNGNDSAAGTSWEAPFLSIQKGIDMAAPGQTITVSNGTYTLTTQLLLNKGVTVTADGGASNTVVDANFTGRVITISDSAAIMDGFTLINGRSTGTDFNGTGVNMTGGTLRNCTVSSCKYTHGGSTQGIGIHMTGGTVESCVIEKNEGRPSAAEKYITGGGLYVEGSACMVTNCLISGNYIGHEWGKSRGGGVYIAAGELVDCVVKNNTNNQGRRGGGYGGGGVFVTGTGMVRNCAISANAVTCVDTTTRGGGVYADGGTVVACVVSDNSGAGYSAGHGTFGGGVYMTGKALIERCVITRNYQTKGGRHGAGVASDGGVMRSCLIMGNTANTLGGGLYITGGTNENCTIVRNACSGGNYGGVYWKNNPVIRNAIVYNNTGGEENDIVPVVEDISGVTYSCAPSLTSGSGNVTGDPAFTDAGFGSGTGFIPGDYHPIIGGPCAGTGFVSEWMGAAQDLGGLPRQRESLVEMGAYSAIPPVSAYVATNGSDSGAGTSWDDPFLTIQKGIDTATALGTVFVSNGTYVLTSQLLVSKGCTIIGVNGSDNTIIDANASGRVITINHSNAVVDGFTLTNGQSAAAVNGGGVNMTGGTLQNCTVTSCKNTAGGSTAQGGGIFMSGSDCLVMNCAIENNLLGAEWVTSKGGGIYLSGGRIIDSVIQNNIANHGRYTGGGGGLFVTGNGMVSNCTVAANASTCVDTTTRGGGVYIDWGTVVDCVVSNNSSQGYRSNFGTFGGGVYMTGQALVERCIITKNYQKIGWTSTRYGAGVASDGGVMRHCLIMGNTANTLGGGLYITGGTNENCTIVRNACVGGNYGGVYWTNTPVIRNAIVYNNTGDVENNIAPMMEDISAVTYSCAPSLASGIGNVTGDPQFVASGSGSGTAFTAGDYHLASGTSCKNNGLTEEWMEIAIDLDRLPRVKDGTVDMGAYERQVEGGTVIVIR